MTFDDFLRRRRLDVAAFRTAEPARVAEWQAWYDALHPDAFLLQVKQVLNDVRRRYHLAEAPPPPPAAEGTAPRPSGRRARPIGPLAEIPILDPAAPLADPETLRAEAPAAAPPAGEDESATSEGSSPPSGADDSPAAADKPADAPAARPTRPRAVIRRPPTPTQGAEADPAAPPTVTETGTWQPATTGSAVPDAPPVPPETAARPGPDVPEGTPGRPEADAAPAPVKPARPPTGYPPACCVLASAFPRMTCSIHRGLLVLALLQALPRASAAQAQPVSVPLAKIKVVLLGTFHYGATSDQNKTAFRDLFSAKRQKELDALTTRLAARKPTRVFVEARVERQRRIDSLYALYQAGKLTDTVARRDETVEVGFRLARASGAALIAADTRQELPYDAVLGWEKAHEKDTGYSYPFFNLDYPFGPETRLPQLAQTPLPAYYAALNTPLAQQKNLYDYLHYALADGSGPEYVGEALTAVWYDRNLKIFTNILRGLDPEQDAGHTIVVLFGAGHTAVLQQFFRNHPLFEVLDVGQVLQ